MFEIFLMVIAFVAGYFAHMKWPDLHKRGSWRGSTP